MSLRGPKGEVWIDICIGKGEKWTFLKNADQMMDILGNFV